MSGGQQQQAGTQQPLFTFSNATNTNNNNGNTNKHAILPNLAYTQQNRQQQSQQLNTNNNNNSISNKTTNVNDKYKSKHQKNKQNNNNNNNVTNNVNNNNNAWMNFEWFNQLSPNEQNIMQTYNNFVTVSCLCDNQGIVCVRIYASGFA